MSSSDEVLEILDDPDADIILCSREHHKFRVLKLHVTKVSAVLRELIQSASTSHAANPTSPLPLVQLSDSGVILSTLFTFILPMLPVLPSTPEYTTILLATAQKYQMESILSRIRATIRSQDTPFICRETAFKVYSLARMHGLRQEALQAARTTLTFPFIIEKLGDELEAIHGIYLHELWKYCQSVRVHLKSDLVAFRATGMPVLTCPPCGPDTIHGARVWLDDYVSSIAESPALFDLTEFYACFSRHIIQSRCSCSIPSNAVRAFWTDLTHVVNGCMTKAESAILPLDESQTALSPASPKNPSPTSPLDPLNTSDATVIIQSCDLVNFRVHQRILAMSSPFFNDLFSLPQPQPSCKEVVDGLPVVRLPEDAEVLSGLITMLYPIPSDLPNSYDKVLTLLAASQKYDMVGVQSRIRGEIQTRTFPTQTGAEASRSYAISSGGQLPSEAERLARLTLEFPMTFEYLCDELPSFQGWALRDLVNYRKRCRGIIMSCFKVFLKLGQPPFNIWVPCTDPEYTYSPISMASTGSSPSWLTQLFQKHINESHEAFSKPLFNPQNIRDLYLSALKDHIISSHCFSCPKVHALNGERFCKVLTDILTLSLNEVHLDLITNR